MEAQNSFNKPVEEWTEIDKQKFFEWIDLLHTESQKLLMMGVYKKCSFKGCEKITRPLIPYTTTFCSEHAAMQMRVKSFHS